MASARLLACPVFTATWHVFESCEIHHLFSYWAVGNVPHPARLTREVLGTSGDGARIKVFRRHVPDARGDIINRSVSGAPAPARKTCAPMRTSPNSCNKGYLG